MRFKAPRKNTGSVALVIAVLVAVAILAPLITYLLWSNVTAEKPTVEPAFHPPEAINTGIENKPADEIVQDGVTSDALTSAPVPTPMMPPPPPPPAAAIADPKSLPPEG